MKAIYEHEQTDAQVSKQLIAFLIGIDISPEASLDRISSESYTQL